MLRFCYYARLVQHCFFRCFYIFFNVEIIFIIRTVLSENNKTSLPLVKNQSTLLCIVYSVKTMTVPPISASHTVHYEETLFREKESPS